MRRFCTFGAAILALFIAASAAFAFGLGKEGARGGFGSGGTIGGASSPYLLSDTFSRYANGNVLGGAQPLIGATTWQVTGAQVPQVASGQVGSAGTGYLYNNLVASPQTIRNTVTFNNTGDTTTLPATMAFSTQTSGLLIKNLLHFNYGRVGFNLGYFDAASSFTSVWSGTWATPIPASTPTLVSLSRIGNVIAMQKGSETWIITDATTAAFWGPTVFFEPNTQGDGFKATISDAAALKVAAAVTAAATLDPSNKNAITLSNANLTAAGTGAGHSNVFSTTGKSSGKYRVEFTINVKGSPTSDNMGMGFGSLSLYPKTTGNLGDDANSLAIFPRNSGGTNQTGIWTNGAYAALLGLFANGGAVGRTWAMEVDFDLKKVWFENVTDSSGLLPVGGYDFSAVGGAPYGLLVNPSSVDQLTVNTGNMPWAKQPSPGFGPWT